MPGMPNSNLPHMNPHNSKQAIQQASNTASKQYSKQPEWLKLPVGCLWLSPSQPRSCQSASADTASCSGHVALCKMHSSPAHTPAAAHDQAKAAI